jgi:transposase
MPAAARSSRLRRLAFDTKAKAHPRPGRLNVLLAALNRALRPLPKTRLASWYRGTILPRLLPMPPSHLSSQRFWNHLDYLDAQALDRLEEDLSRRLVDRYGLNLQTLFFDATNFDTFIDSQTRARLPQRGHAKSKRTDLRVVGLALMVSADFHIPLFWQVYPGNQPDSVTFSKVLPKLARRHRQLLAGVDQHLTLVFDKGNNPQDDLRRLARTPYHIIGSLVPSQHSDLLAIPCSGSAACPHSSAGPGSIGPPKRSLAGPGPLS